MYVLVEQDIFKGEAPYTLTKIEGIPLPEIEEDFFDNSIPDNKLDIPDASQLSPSDFKNREEDAPAIGVPVNEKATVKKDTLTDTKTKSLLKEKAPAKTNDSTQTEN